MRKTPKKLSLKRETVRQISKLDLSRAVGGGEQIAETQLVTCPWTQAAQTVNCG